MKTRRHASCRPAPALGSIGRSRVGWGIQTNLSWIGARRAGRYSGHFTPPLGEMGHDRFPPAGGCGFLRGRGGRLSRLSEQTLTSPYEQSFNQSDRAGRHTRWIDITVSIPRSAGSLHALKITSKAKQSKANIHAAKVSNAKTVGLFLI